MRPLSFLMKYLLRYELARFWRMYTILDIGFDNDSLPRWVLLKSNLSAFWVDAHARVALFGVARVVSTIPVRQTKSGQWVYELTLSYDAD